MNWVGIQNFESEVEKGWDFDGFGQSERWNLLERRKALTLVKLSLKEYR